MSAGLKINTPLMRRRQAKTWLTSSSAASQSHLGCLFISGRSGPSMVVDERGALRFGKTTHDSSRGQSWCPPTFEGRACGDKSAAKFHAMSRIACESRGMQKDAKSPRAHPLELRARRFGRFLQGNGTPRVRPRAEGNGLSTRCPCPWSANAHVPAPQPGCAMGSIAPRWQVEQLMKCPSGFGAKFCIFASC